MAKMSAKKIKSSAKSKPLVQNCFIIHVSIREDMGLIDPEDGWVGPTHTGCAEKMITTTLTSAILTSEAVEARTLLQSMGKLLSF